MRIKYQYKGNYQSPKKQTVGSAGIDLFNNTDKDIEIKPGKYAIISTGFYVEIPEGYVRVIIRSWFIRL